MAPRPKLSASALVRTAVDLVDSQGLSALSISTVAARLTVRPSALYTYCAGLDELRELVAIAAVTNLIEEVGRAAMGCAGADAIGSMSVAYRDFARQRPGMFAATLRQAAPGEQRRAAIRELLAVFSVVFSARGLDQVQATLAAHTTHSAVHGFVVLEHLATAGDQVPGEPYDDVALDLDKAFEHLLRAICGGLDL